MNATISCRFLAMLLCLAVAGGAACAPRKTVKKAPEAESDRAADIDLSTAPTVDVAEANIRGSEFAAVPDLQAVHFPYDTYTLDYKETLRVLKANADYLKSHRDAEVLVAGHCDERGTIGYNLALGQKRAKAVREYYIRLGVPGKAVATISYGKEKPSCSESTEDCWAANRRAETRIRARTVSNHQAPSDAVKQ